MWKSAAEIEETLGGLPGRQILADLWALHYFAKRAVYSPEYVTNDLWSDIVVLSPCGEELIENSRAALGQCTRADLCLAIFGLFYHHDLLIDHKRTDASLVLDRLNSEFQEQLITWPYRFGRLLYDRFNDTVESDHTDHLEWQQARKLLGGTPAGVYQVGAFVSGPYGIISSAEARFVPPRATLPLWHCSDTGCGALHSMALMPPPIPLVQTYARLESAVREKYGPSSEWPRPMNRLFLRPAEGRACYDLPVLIADAIVQGERTALVAAALRSDRAPQIRSVLQTRTGGGQMTPEAIADSLGEAEQVQILLTLADVDLRSLVDACVHDRRIDVPLNEIRAAGVTYADERLSSRDRSSELSSLGLRSKAKVPLASLHTIIWESYETLGLLEELGWKLRRKPGVPPSSALMDFIRTNRPSQVVNELVLASMPVTGVVCERFAIPLEAADRSGAIVDRLLWKLGFNQSRFPDEYPRFRKRIEEFSSTVLPQSEIRTEEERARVRSVGVNLFVSVEHFIQELIAYNTWLLASDHFVATRFTYDSYDAVEGVSRILGRELRSGDLSFQWQNGGGNTLGTLLVYAQAMVEWMEDLRTRDPLTVVRPEMDLPHYADESDQWFMFRHIALWADTNPDELARYVQGISGVVAQLHRAGIAAIRNGLDHRRDDHEFPKPDAMLACSLRLRDALDLADVHRYVPKVFWLQSFETDREGRQQFVFSDYLNKEVTLGGPPVISGLRRPGFREPVLIAPGNLLGEPNAELRFTIRERSAYAEYWANYPRRRRIPSPHPPQPTEESASEPVE